MPVTEQLPVIAVVGATATGKTALGAAIAEQYHGEVISADSMQLYEGLDIATAKPTPDEMRGIPHHLISVLPPEHACSVAEYVGLAREKIAQIHANGKLPVIVGGTGLYIDALLDNIQFPDIPADDALRARLNAEAETLGRTAMRERLMQCDPESAERLHENNLRRIIRALEVYELTGIPLSEHARRSRAVPAPWNILRLGIGFTDREKLYQRIRLRVDSMVQEGLLDEVRTEYSSGCRGFPAPIPPKHACCASNRRPAAMPNGRERGFVGINKSNGSCGMRFVPKHEFLKCVKK